MKAPARLAIALLLLVAGASRSGAAAAVSVDSVALVVSDLARSTRFYAALGFSPVAGADLHGEEWERLYAVFPARLRVARMELGEEHVELVEFVTPRGRAAPSDARSDDRSFQHLAIVVADMDEAWRRVSALGIHHVSPVPQVIPRTNAAAGGIRAFYFRDPDGHPLELIWYPPGRGDPRWQGPSSSLFLGIDHTAIATADTEASLAFWRDRLGFEVIGASLNEGIEQQRLSGVRGARVRITALRAAKGPGVELLEYLEPEGGRPWPPDAAANDLVQARTRLRVAGAEALADLAEPVELPATDLGFSRAALVRDPDGHTLEVVVP